MSDDPSTHVMAAALAALLSDALDRDENRHLVDDDFRAALRELRSRVEGEVERQSARTRLRLAGDVQGDKRDAALRVLDQ